MQRTFTNEDGYRVTLDYSGERPTVQYSDGDPHRLHNEQHATDVVMTLTTAGYTED